MHLQTVIAFSIFLVRLDQRLEYAIIPADAFALTLVFIAAQPPLLAALSFLESLWIRKLLSGEPQQRARAQHIHHALTHLLRAAALAGFASAALFTPWANWFELRHISPALQILGDLGMLIPFLLNATAVWIGAYPLDRMLRARRIESGCDSQLESWSLLRYLDLQLRHHVLILAVPLLIILFTYNLLHAYERNLQVLFWNWIWITDVLLGAVALFVFAIAPMMLIRIWHTESLKDGPLRTRLESLCGKAGLCFRDIRVWNSDGAMINAAVMGVVPSIRYVMLSDGLLQSMPEERIEAVFGHEIGHIKHRHIPFFLIFTYVGWVLVAGIMELLSQLSVSGVAFTQFDRTAILSIGLGLMVIFWGIGFGWLSRWFEWQADIFGASCVTPKSANCTLPCSVHPDSKTVNTSESRVCASGAAIFSQALDQVALLNGIPANERTWRHPTISSRLRHLATVAGDPKQAQKFARRVLRIKVWLLALAVIGSAGTVYYYIVAQPQLARWMATIH